MTYDKETIIRMRQEGYSWRQLDEHFGVNPDAVRGWARNQDWYKDIKSSNPHVAEEGMAFSRNEQGEYSIDNEFTFDNQQLFSDDDLLRMNNLDPLQFDLLRVRRGKWSVTIKDGQRKWNFQSRIDAAPKVDKITEADIIEEFKKDIKPVELRVQYIGENNLVLALADLHFGVTKLEHTLDKLTEIKDIISNGYKTIVIEQLGDLFHSSQMKASQTLKGTLLEDVDMVQALEDAKTFFDVIIQAALVNAKEVRVEHAGGNHSDNLEYMFLMYLEAKYPDLVVNRHNDTRSAYLLDNVGIMITHGDKAKNKLPGLFAHEFKMIWARAETMEIHTGHRHSVEKEFDGVVLRQMGTIKPNDGYEIVNGWVTNRKVIQLIEYDEDRAKVIYEV